ncbi:MAG: DUF2304 domain-containing protein [Ileibacterium sp.]|nr:DUF2304 domain-containing protein [Ileibacterium sp.]
MGIRLQLVFIIASLLTFVYVILRIRKHGLNIEDSITWILWSILLLIVSFFPQISIFVSNALGFISPSNFILVLFIFFLYIMVFTQNIEISKLKGKQQDLIQKLSLIEHDQRAAAEKASKEEA